MFLDGQVDHYASEFNVVVVHEDSMHLVSEARWKDIFKMTCADQGKDEAWYYLENPVIATPCHSSLFGFSLLIYLYNCRPLHAALPLSLARGPGQVQRSMGVPRLFYIVEA